MKAVDNLFKMIGISALLLVAISCNNDDPVNVDSSRDLTIFYINDPHAQIDNFAKIKHIVDAERANTDVLLVCAGDIFSGNPIVDQYAEKGFPIIDLMNKTGFDASVIGNHEFDYGIDILKDRMAQAEFDWVCANVNTSGSALPQPAPFTTITKGDLTITLLGLIETFGKPDDVIPATHPWRVADLQFQVYTDILDTYQDLKQQEQADLLIALTHLGQNADINLANQLPALDLILGGHTHSPYAGEENNTPIFRAGAYLSNLGKLQLSIRDNKIIEMTSSTIDLNIYSEEDPALKQIIENYDDNPAFDEVIGYSKSNLSRTELGCFYTTALKDYMHVDASFQNTGGIRADLDEGDITTLEIYSIDPFNNGSVVFTMTVEEVKKFFTYSGTGLHVAGISFEKTDTGLIIYDDNGDELNNSELLTIGINDYIPAVYDQYFPYEEAEFRELTTAESIIQYLKTENSMVDYEGCDQYFQY